MYERILVPLDGSGEAEQALPHAEALAKAFRSTVTLLRATPPLGAVIADAGGALPVTLGGPIVDAAALLEAERAEAAAYLWQLVDRLRAQGVTADAAQPTGAPAEAIVDAARALNAGLIAMTTHGRGGLRRLVLGSVADTVLRHAPCPLLLVRVSDETADTGT